MTRNDEPKPKSNFFSALRAPVANAEVKTRKTRAAGAHEGGRKVQGMPGGGPV